MPAREPADADRAAAIEHLRAADPVLARGIDLIATGDGEAPERRRPRDHYGALIRSITGQQLSTRAAAAIYGRLEAAFGGRTPSPEELLAAEPETLRAAAGLSRAKVASLRSLAEHIVDGRLEIDRIDRLDDEAVEAELVAVKGIGTWTAHMFLLFQLQRPDVLAWGDLGVRAAVRDLWGLAELPDRAQLERIAEPWRPWRSLACRYLWRIRDATPG